MPVWDFLALGGASCDLILQVPRLPAHDEKLMAVFAGRSPGGLVANAACAAASLGLRTAWAGALGSDEAGQLLLDDFSRFGVDTTMAQLHPGQASDFCVVILDATGERSILVVPNLPGETDLTPALRSALSETRLVYTIPRRLDWFRDVAGLVHSGNGGIMVDLEPTSPVQGDELRRIIAATDIVSCNRVGMNMATGCDDARAAADILLSLGPRVVVITLGRDGALAFSKDAESRVDGHRVPAVDTTGAGDCFNGAFAFSMLQSWEVSRSLEFANAAAALSIQAIGARGHLPKPDEVEEFLRTNSQVYT